MNKQRVDERTLARATRALSGTVRAGLLVSGVALGVGLAHAQATAGGDAQVQSAVTAALGADAQLRGQQVSATVANGVVTLSGTVAQDGQRIAAEQTVAQVSGVRSIDDGISVGQAVASAETGVATPPQDGNVGGEQQAQTGSMQEGAPGNMPPPPPAETMPPPQQGDGQYPQSGEQQYPQNGQYPPPPQNGQYPYPGPQAGQYGPPPQGGYPGQGGQYGPPRRPYVAGVTPEKQNASGPVTLATGLLLNVRSSEPLSTGQVKAGQYVQFTAASDLYANGVVAIPRGAVLTGQVVESKNAGPFGGSPKLDLKLTTLALGSQTYPIATDVWSSQGPSKTGYTAANTVGGAAFGALIGAVAGGGVGAGIGAVAGGTSGALISGATHGPRLDLPAEALLQFHLAAPLTVQPVNYGEAERLAASVPQQPVLRQRPMYVRAPYGYYPRPYPYPAYYYARPY